uniref:Mitochondrial fission factor n=1 Tax=Parastrongyloides trichosuri TaxID=131310 RepID=A0A0N4ZPX4_PARTI
MTSTMQIPDHISGTGHAKLLEPFSNDSFINGVSNSMKVPEKIAYGKDCVLYGYDSNPIDDEVTYNYDSENSHINLQELPSKLTANEYIENENIDTSRYEEQHSITSIAVEENAIRELKMMKRQLARLAVRVYEIEDELDKRKSRDWQSYAMSFVGVTSLIISIMMFSQKRSKIF